MSCKAEVVCVGIIVMLAIILPIFILYGDGLEATDAKRNNLFITVLVPLFMTIIGCLTIFYIVPLILEICESGEYFKCLLIPIIVVLAVSIPVGWIYGLSFEGIPDSCATLNECQSYCSGKSEVYRANLTNIHNVKLVISQDKEIECGTWPCICPSYHNHTNTDNKNISSTLGTFNSEDVQTSL